LRLKILQKLRTASSTQNLLILIKSIYKEEFGLINFQQKNKNYILQPYSEMIYLFSQIFNVILNLVQLSYNTSNAFLSYAPNFSNRTRHLCEKVGTALSNVMLQLGDFPSFSNVQTPFGPRKSGIPAAVLIPAPESIYIIKQNITTEIFSTLQLYRISAICTEHHLHCSSNTTVNAKVTVITNKLKLKVNLHFGTCSNAHLFAKVPQPEDSEMTF